MPNIDSVKLDITLNNGWATLVVTPTILFNGNEINTTFMVSINIYSPKEIIGKPPIGSDPYATLKPIYQFKFHTLYDSLFSSSALETPIKPTPSGTYNQPLQNIIQAQIINENPGSTSVAPGIVLPNPDELYAILFIRPHVPITAKQSPIVTVKIP